MKSWNRFRGEPGRPRDPVNHPEPTDAQSWVDRGDGLMRAGQYGEALTAYSMATDLDERLVRAWSGLGLALFFLKRHIEALERFDWATHLDAGCFEAWYGKGLALGDLGRSDEAIACLDHALDLGPGPRDRMLTLWMKANLLEKCGRLREALAGYERAAAEGDDRASQEAERLRRQEF